MHRRLLVLWLAGALTLLTVSAQAAANPSVDLPTSFPVKIDVYGDSLGDGLWQGMFALLKAHPEADVRRRSKVGYGFTRPDYIDWLIDLHRTLDSDPADVAVIMVGANDQESLRDANRKGYLFQTAGWEREYTQRIETVLKELSDHHVTAIWVGLPIMGKNDLNAGAGYLNGLFTRVSAAHGVTFVSMDKDFLDSDGNFMARVADGPEKGRQVRTEDGIHFTVYGYELIAQKVLAAIATQRSQVDHHP